MPQLGNEPTPEANRYGVGSTSCLKLRKKMSDVGLDGLLRQKQALPDLTVHEAVGDELKNFALAGGRFLFELAGRRTREWDDRAGSRSAASCSSRLEAAAVVSVPVQDLFALSGVHASRIGLLGHPL